MYISQNLIYDKNNYFMNTYKQQMFFLLFQKVFGVSIENRREVARRTNNIQARVGFQLPPEQGTHGDTIIENNPECGDLFVGPAQDGGTTTIITCHG